MQAFWKSTIIIYKEGNTQSVMVQKFQSVTNNQEKFETYKIQMERFNHAKDQGFYLEGIFILYAMLEDRLSSFLYYAGVVNQNRDGLTKNNEVRPDLEVMLSSLGNKKYRISNISNKISIFQQIMAYTTTTPANDSSIGYHFVLNNQIKKTKGQEEMISLLDDISKWCQARNELVHALLNKNVDRQKEKLLSLIEEAFLYCRQLDNFVRAFKRGNTIRKQFNIQ
jgi:hypothetical protein